MTRTDTHRRGAASRRQSARTWLPCGGGPSTVRTAVSIRQGSATDPADIRPVLVWYSISATVTVSDATSYVTTSSAWAVGGWTNTGRLTAATQASIRGAVTFRKFFAPTVISSPR
ncbi:hypothetical protein H5U41_26200 [Mycolicibacterium holsaticum DSM 44478 = JCM 12374]|nr:hypothetical protein K3U96_00625 [Mycolicibacterium holsaticum DSM 44478 = JCM 12374]UNC09769.1 hypothetical protein H5U41_26200 [Mycolicibacterium holsaticum DSM 44478 = JCM 12374]